MYGTPQVVVLDVVWLLVPQPTAVPSASSPKSIRSTRMMVRAHARNHGVRCRRCCALRLPP